jgi:hypothetical protein
LHEEVRDNAFKALRATSRALDLPFREQEPKHYEEKEFSDVDLATALGITGYLAADIFKRNDIIASEMSEAKMRSIQALVLGGVTMGTLAATAGPIVLLYSAAGILIVSVGVLAVGGAFKWLGY